MDRLGFGDTIPGAAERDTSFDKFRVVDLADLLVLAVVRHKANALFLEPVATRHALRYEHGGTMVTLTSIDSSLADAVVARLAILTNLDLAVRDEQVGRLRVRTAGTTGDSLFKPVVEVLVVVRVTSQGLVLEMRRIVGAEDLFEFEPTQPPGALMLGNLGQVGPYRILGELGRGGMGIVYRAEHTVLQRPVAIKVLHGGAANDPESAARFVAEARAACRAHHPGIVDVYDFGRLPDRRAYLVMELVDGDSLDVLLRKGLLPAERALDIALQMAEALEAAAKSGVVHRDLKPANIFLTKDGRVKIGDFGVAKVLDPHRPGAEGHTIVGTVYYMAPEQARGVPVDARSDLYSLGCMLYEMLSGKVPFDGDTPSEVLERQMSEPPPPIGGELPESVERVVKRAMAKRPEERYQSAAELKADLATALAALSRGGWRKWLP